MASSPVDIANAALIRIGLPLIASFDDGTQAATVIGKRWPNARDVVLRRHPWNCAKSRVALTPDSTAPAFDYTYQFSLPSDYLRVLDVSSDPRGSDVRGGDRPRYAIEGRKILFDHPVLYLRYIRQVENVVQFDAECADAIASYLAYDMSQFFLHNEALTKQLSSEYEDAIKEARNTNAQENTQAMVVDHFERARRAGP